MSFSTFALARLEIGWNASPASFTTDSVRFELSSTKRSNAVRAKSLCSCRSSVGFFASAKERTVFAVCSRLSRLFAAMSWPIDWAPVAAILPASTNASRLPR